MLDALRLAQVVGDKLVVAYLVQDSDPENPMQFDGQGTLYTMPSRGYGSGSITDNAGEIYAALGCDGYGGVDTDKQFSCAPYIDHRGILQKVHSLRDIAALQYLEKVGNDFALTGLWLEQREFELDEGETPGQAFTERYNEIWRDLEDCNGVFSEEVEALAISLYADYWQEIAGPFVVPCDYCANNHGPGTTSLSVTSWDGDPDDLPSAIWVANKGAIENLEASTAPDGVDIHWAGSIGVGGSTLHAIATKDGVEVFDAGVESGSWRRALDFIKVNYGEPSVSDLRAAAGKYAEGVCSEYAKWCNGEVFGCVTETFQRVGENDDEWELTDEGGDSCWGFIGHDYAKETLQGEYFDSVIARLEKTSADVSLVAGDYTEGGSCD